MAKRPAGGLVADVAAHLAAHPEDADKPGSVAAAMGHKTEGAVRRIMHTYHGLPKRPARPRHSPPAQPPKAAPAEAGAMAAAVLQPGQAINGTDLAAMQVLVILPGLHTKSGEGVARDRDGILYGYREL